MCPFFPLAGWRVRVCPIYKDIDIDIDYFFKHMCIYIYIHIYIQCIYIQIYKECVPFFPLAGWRVRVCPLWPRADARDHAGRTGACTFDILCVNIYIYIYIYMLGPQPGGTFRHCGLT